MPKESFSNAEFRITVPRYGPSAVIFANVLLLLNKGTYTLWDHLALAVFVVSLPFSIVSAISATASFPEGSKVSRLLNTVNILVSVSIMLGMGFVIRSVSVMAMWLYLLAISGAAELYLYVSRQSK